MDRVSSLINILNREFANDAGPEVLLKISEELKITLEQQVNGKINASVSVWLPGSIAPRLMRKEKPVSQQVIEKAETAPVREPVSSYPLQAPKPPSTVTQQAENEVETENIVANDAHLGEHHHADSVLEAGLEEPSAELSTNKEQETLQKEEDYAAIFNAVPDVTILPEIDLISEEQAEEEKMLQLELTEEPEVPEATTIQENYRDNLLKGLIVPNLDELWQKAVTPAETASPASSQEEAELNERIAERTKALNEVFAEREKELAEVLSEPKINDLRRAISINEKYQFINSLFRGDEDMFERSLKTLNNFGSLPEARYWMQRELVIKLGWNDQDELVHRFYRLLSRRFA